MWRWQTYLVHSSLGTGYIIFGRYYLLYSMGGPYHVARPLIIPVRNILPCDHPGPTPKGPADITGLPPPSVRVAAPKDLSGRVQRGIYAQRGWITGACNFVLRSACNLALLKTRTRTERAVSLHPPTSLCFCVFAYIAGPQRQGRFG